MSVPTAHRPNPNQYPQAHFAAAPETNPQASSLLSKLMEKKALVIGGSVAAIGAAAVAGVVGFALGGGEKTSATAEKANVTLENATPDQFWSDTFTDTERVQYADKLLHEKIDPQYHDMTLEQASYKRLQAKLTALGRPELSSLVTPSKSNTANEALVQLSVADAAAVYVDDSNTGEKILAAVTDDSNPGLETQRETVRTKHQLSPEERLDTDFATSFVGPDAAASAAAGHSVEQATPIVSDGNRLGNIVTEASVPTRVATVVDSQNMEHVSEDVQTFVGGRWVTRDVIGPNASTWIPPKTLVNIKAK